MGLEIRPATFSDEEGALYLLEQLFEPPGGTPPDYTRQRSSASFRWAVEQPNADILLAVDRNEVVGLTSVYADIQSLGFGPKCWLQDMVVDKERRSEGIGEQLMRQPSIGRERAASLTSSCHQTVGALMRTGSTRGRGSVVPTPTSNGSVSLTPHPPLRPERHHRG